MEANATEVTEVKCAEKRQGGLKFEVFLSESNSVGITPPRILPSPAKPLSVEKIELKLKAAEERRALLEQARKASVAEKLERAREKREEQEEEFKTATKEALIHKLEVTEEKREAYISDIKAKLKDQEKRGETVRNNKVRLSNSHEEESQETTASSG